MPQKIHDPAMLKSGGERMLGYATAEVMNKFFLCTTLTATESLRSTREDQK